MNRFLALAATALCCCAVLAQPKVSREDKVKNDRKKVEAEGFWIYNDLPKALAEAEKSGKPILVVLRCIPCEECVKLDDDLVDRDPVIRPLLEKFVCVRVVSTNGLDLSLFQFDTDQSFAVFMLNADKTIYGRFGTRSHRTNWLTDVSLPGMGKALQGGLDLHAGYPKNKESLVGKRGPDPLFASPEKFPSLSAKYGPELAKTGNVVQSCIHCHQIGDAQREYYRKKREAIPEELLFPYPHPKTLGMILDPKESATLEKVEAGSIAEKAGFKSGDSILNLAGQPLVSMADMQWILHNTPGSGAKVQANVRRVGKNETITLDLPEGWKRNGDLSWRSSSWGLRRMSTGGMLLETLPAEERAKLKVPDGAMALRAKHVGQYGAHAAAKNAGFLVGDVIVEFDGKTAFANEGEVLVHGVTKRKPGEKVGVTVLRGGQKMAMTLPIQE